MRIISLIRTSLQRGTDSRRYKKRMTGLRSKVAEFQIGVSKAPSFKVSAYGGPNSASSGGLPWLD